MSLYLITSSQPASRSPKPADTVIFDTLAQPTKNIQLVLTGAVEIDIFASIEADALEPDITKKIYCYIGSYVEADKELAPVPEELLDKLKRYRYVKIAVVRGVTPQVLAQSTY